MEVINTGRRVALKEAAMLTGLTEGELRRGVKNHIYPCMFIGASNKKILFDLDLLEACLDKLAHDNMAPKGIRALPERARANRG